MDAWTIKQYPAKEQAELRVRIMVPGSWFPGLTGEERSLNLTRPRRTASEQYVGALAALTQLHMKIHIHRYQN